MKKPKPCSNSRLYVTEDIYEDNVWFVRTDVEQIARLKLNGKWEIFFYPFRLRLNRDSLKECIPVIENLFKEYWIKKYGEMQ